MELTIGKNFPFSAAHQLWNNAWPPEENEEVFGKCATLHGHNYVLTVEVSGPLNSEAMVLNYYQLSDIVEPLVSKWDHQFLNQLPEFEGKLTTAENIVMAAKLYLDLQHLPTFVHFTGIVVKETDKTFARWFR